MQELVIDQIEYFFVSFAWGIFLLWLYDGIRLWRHYGKPGAFLSGFMDILFWCLSALFFYRMCYFCNYGMIRAYSIAALAGGMLFYRFYCSPHVFSTTCHILDKIFGKIATLYKKTGSVIMKMIRLR